MLILYRSHTLHYNLIEFLGLIPVRITTLPVRITTVDFPHHVSFTTSRDTNDQVDLVYSAVV